MASAVVPIVSALCFLLAIASAAKPDSKPQVACLNEQGKPVDWYIGYKFPMIKHKTDDRFNSGYRYAYITSEDVDQSDKVATTGVADNEDDYEIFWFTQRFKDLLRRYVGLGGRSNMSSSRERRTRSRNRNHLKDTRWSLSPFKINDVESVLMSTLRAAYETDVNVIIYNDETGITDSFDSDDSNMSSGSGTSSKKRSNNNNRAHAKGVLMMDEHNDRSVWLTHSIPRFPPPLNEPLSFANSAKIYGQTFMCITFDTSKSGKQVVDHLMTMQPQIYDRRVSDRMYTILPNLRGLDESESMLGTYSWPTNSSRPKLKSKLKLAQMITTSAGQALHLFSKSRAFGVEFYAGWLDEELGIALYVETWRRGGGTPLNSSCPANTYHINNVVDLKYDENAGWSYLKDHSKWAISEDSDNRLVCIGDLNRMESQTKRGGGAVCIECSSCWHIFSNTIQDVEPCPLGSNNKINKRASLNRPLIEKMERASLLQ